MNLVTIVYMGDSVTAGQHVPNHLRWTDLVTVVLQDDYKDTPTSIYAVNKGVSGETTRLGLERFPRDVQDARPDILTLQYGLNDCSCWLTDRGISRVSISAFEANLEEMIDRARAFGTKHIILGNNYPTLRHKVMLNGQTYEEANALYSEVVERVVRQMDVFLCDTRGMIRGPLDKYLMPYPDQLHLTKEGHAAYAQMVLPLLDEVVREVIRDNSLG